MKPSITPYVTYKGWEFPYLRIAREHAEVSPLIFQNKVVIVTGASSGIGRAMARAFAGKKAMVILASRNEKALEAVKSEICATGGSAVIFPTDVTQEEQCRVLIEKTVQTYGKIDILVNNAGISMRSNFRDVHLDVLRKLMDTNFWGTVYCTKYALPHILRQKGSIVGISSICGITPLPGRTGYAASKHAIKGFLESLRLEISPGNLHVMLVHPTFTASNIRYAALNSTGHPQGETPLEENKLMTAERVAQEVLSGIEQRKKNVILSAKGRMITWIYRHLPNLAERFILEEMKKENGSPV
jgi:short-subunit dehydrogenase